MRIITVSREFGSGGRELAKRLSDQLGFDYYDKEVIDTIAAKKKLDGKYVESILENHPNLVMSLTFRNTFSFTPSYNIKNDLLVEEKRVMEEIAALGKDCIIVGRNADIILREYQPFNIFVCAEKDAKVKRCVERAPEGENLSEKELIRKMKQIDKNRSQTREIIGGSAWGQRDAYHLTVNTTDWEIKELVPAVADFAQRWFGRK